MFGSKKWTVIAIAVATMFAASCSPPQEAIDSARAALSQAEALDAARYAPEAWEQAQQAQQAADVELAAQAEKFGAFRSYGHASELLAQAQQAAAAAEVAAVTGREAARLAAETALADANSAIDAAQAQLDALKQCGRKPKGFAADAERLAGLVEGLRVQIPEIENQIGSEDYLGAQTQAEAALAEANALVAELTEAATKLGC